MAEKSEGFVNWEDPYLSQATGYPDEEEQGVGISDYAKSIGRGAVSALVETPLTLASQALRSAGANKTSLFLDTLSDVAGETAKENLTDTMSPEAKRRAGAAFAFPEEGQASVWEDPISSIGLKAAGALPSLIASAFPAMRIAKAFGAAAGALAGGAVAGGMNAAEVYQDIKEEIQKLPDAKLREQNDMYRELRGMGVDEAEARAQVVSTISGYKPIIVGAISALTSGGFGLEGMLAKTASKEVAKKGLVKGGAEGLVKETGQEASESLSSKYASETALEEGNIKPFDWQKIIEATIEGGVVGGVLGGGVGGITNIGGDGKAAPKVQQTDASPLDPTTKFALDQKTQEQTTQPPPPPPAGQSAAVTPGVTPPNTEGQEATPPTGEQAPPAPPEPSRAYTFFYNEALKRLEKKGIEVTPEIADELSQRVTDAVGASKDTKARWSALGTILGDLTKRFTPAPAPTAALAAPAQQQADQAAIIEGLKVLDEKTPPKPEPKSVLGKQVEMLVKGERDAVFIPSSTPEKDRPRKPNGFRSVPVKGGLIYFNQGVFSEGQILKASRNGKLNEILPYGPTTNVQAAADVVQGADPRMVQVIKDNVPVAEAVSSTKTVDQDAAAMAAQAPADATVVIRDSVDEALAERDAAREAEQQEPIVVTPELRAKWEELGTRTLPDGRRVLPNLTDDAIIQNELAERADAERRAKIEKQRVEREAAKFAAEFDNLVSDEKAQPVLEVKDATESKKGKKAVAKKKDDLTVAKQLLETFTPTPAEAKSGKAYTRQAAQTRARKMLDAAERAKVKIPGQWREGVPEHLGFLLLVKKFVKLLNDTNADPQVVAKATDQFMSDEFYARQGEWENIKSTRQVEGGAQAKKKDLDENQRYDDDTRERGEINIDKMAATTGETEDERVGRSYALAEENPDQAEVFESGFTTDDEVTNEVTPTEPVTENIEEKIAARRAEGQFLKTEEAPTKAVAVEKKVGRPKLQVDKPKVEGKITLTKKSREIVAKAAKRKAPSEAAARALAAAYDIDFNLVTGGLKYSPQDGIELLEVIEQYEALPDSRKELFNNNPLDYAAARNNDPVMDDVRDGVDVDPWLNEKYAKWDAMSASQKAEFEDGFIQFLYNEDPNLFDGIDGAAPGGSGMFAPASMTQEDAVLQGMLIDPKTDELMPALQVTTVAKMKPFLHNFDKIENAVLREVTKFVWERIDERIPNMKVMLMTADQIERIKKNADAFYTRVGQTDVIVLAAEKIGDPNYLTAVLTHEAVHGMTSLGIDSDPAFYNTIKLISDEVRSVIGDQRLSDLYGIKLKKEVNEKLSEQYGFTDAHEFIAEALSNPAFQKMLADIQISDKLAKQLGMQTWSNRSMWSAIVNTVRKLLNMPPNTFTALEGVMRVTDNIMAKQETLPPTAGLAPPSANPNLITREAAQRSANRWNPRVKGKTEAEARAQYEAGLLTAREATEAAGVAKYKIIDKRTGAVVGETNSLSRAMWMRDNRDDAHGGYRYRIETEYPAWARGEQDGRAISREAAQRAAQGFADAVTPTSIGKRKALLGLSTLDQIRQWYRGTFVNAKGEDLLEKIISNIQRIRPFADAKRERGEQLAQRFMDFAAKNREAANEFADIANSVTMLNAQLFGANEHWGSDRRDGWQARELLPDLQRRFAAIEKANPGARQLYDDMVAYYRDTQNEITRQLVDNILAEHDADLSDAARASLTKKVMEGTLDDAAKELVNNATIFNALKDARALRLVQGDYFPLMRHGDFVVQTRDSIGDLHGGVEVTPGVIEFTGETEKEALKKAEAFAKRTTKGPGFTQADGVPLILSGPTATEVSSESSEFKFRVKVQLDGLHMFDTQAEAESFIQSEKGKFAQISEAPLLKRDDGKFGEEMSNSALAAIAKSISAREGIPLAQRQMMVTALKQAAVRQMAGNRVQKRALPRRGFIGASDDLARNTLVYAEASTRYLGKLRYMPLVREAFSEMQKVTEAAKFSKDHQVMEQLLNHMRARVDANVISEQETSPLIRDVMTMSSIDKLASPAYSLIQTLQPTMMTLPYLSGRYGIGQAGAAIAQAYRVVGAGAAIGGGLRNTKQSIVQFAKTALDSTDVLGSIMSNVAKEKDGKQLTAVLNELVERGILDKNAGMEVAEVVTKGRGKWAMGLSKVDRITRQLPAAIEQVNRAVSAVAAYRLAVEKGESHEKAMSRAFDTVANTQGDYSAMNAPAIFNHPLWRISLQFKKYGQMYYAMFGDMLYRAFKDASPEERAVARKQLAHVIGVQILAAGALGIPGMEVIKLGVMAAAALGIGGGYDDFEREVREAASAMFGKYAGELITKGVIPRAMGIDLSSRLGADSLLTFGEPKKYDETNVGAYLTNIFAGAPGSLIIDQFKAARGFADAARTGDSSQAWKSAELLPMPKFISDLAKASRKAIEGQTSSKSGRQTEEPIGLGTAALNAFGLRTADQAEKGAAKGAQIAEAERRREVTGSMTKLKNQFAEAKSEGERVRVLARLKQLNATLPEEERQTPAQFRAFAKKFQKDKAAGMVSGGARYRNEAEKAAADRAAAVYNYTR